MRKITFPKFSGLRCIMMPYIQGEPESVPAEYSAYSDILSSIVHKRGDIGFLTIDESQVNAGAAHRGDRSKFSRALHTEVGVDPNRIYVWGGGNWANSHRVTLEQDTRIILANNLDNSCTIWNAEHKNTSLDGDIGHAANMYPYSEATYMKAGEVHEIGILTPHESLPVKETFMRQFLRIISSGVHGREEYFTQNPLMV